MRRRIRIDFHCFLYLGHSLGGGCAILARFYMQIYFEPQCGQHEWPELVEGFCGGGGGGGVVCALELSSIVQ